MSEDDNQRTKEERQASQFDSEDSSQKAFKKWADRLAHQKASLKPSKRSSNIAATKFGLNAICILSLFADMEHR
jgi:hypothetical protein